MPPDQELLRELHANLWGSLRRTYSTDLLLLAVLYIVNFTGFLIILSVARGLSAQNAVIPIVATIISLPILNMLFLLSLRNSRQEVERLIYTLTELYKDNGLDKYFDVSRAEYYKRRYQLWTVLTPTIMAIAIILGLAIGFAR